ncbi:uracil-DNA glycosylase family protein [uncultured Sphingomonas sp.]|uniref:uracil-DNA glycosylase family protein n=1 Tax=uncultured Sphingomonas sp. TaxID=158754 RepID=UPI0035CA83B3
MGAYQKLDWRALAASTLDWWRDAGVDLLVDEDPVDWLEPPPPVAPAQPVSPAPGPAAMPADLASFLAWRIGPGAPEAAWPGRRLGPEGAVTTTIVVTDLPDREDLTAGRLMSGTSGVLLDRMLAAIGLSRGTVQLVPVATARPPAGRIPPADEPQLAETIRRHLALARPERVLLLGNAASRAVLGMDCQAARGSLHIVNHESGEAGVIASFHPRFLLERPTAKADAWRDLRLLMGIVGR